MAVSAGGRHGFTALQLTASQKGTGTYSNSLWPSGWPSLLTYNKKVPQKAAVSSRVLYATGYHCHHCPISASADAVPNVGKVQ